ncbi:hypothetical protein NQD34_007810 [Periophthalmus magnuspinnatus]|nr:hypothetical protein NQD34_007810 [Periophthalmus magnuspinnatus]
MLLESKGCLRCEECDKIFKNIRALNTHRHLHRRTKHKCSICKRQFLYAKVFHLHQKKCRKYKLRCDKRGVKFSLITQHRWHQCDHQRALRGGEGFWCEQCGLKCLSVKTLQKHLLLHSPARQYQCSQCSCRFHNSRCLKNHLATHQEEKPHTCDVCGRTYALKARLKDHQLLHLKVKPHPCSKCGKSFIRPYLLRAHLLKKHPWSCKEDREKRRAEQGGQRSERQNTGHRMQRRGSEEQTTQRRGSDGAEDAEERVIWSRECKGEGQTEEWRGSKEQRMQRRKSEEQRGQRRGSEDSEGKDRGAEDAKERKGEEREECAEEREGEKEQRAVWCERRREYRQGRAFECSHCGKTFTKKHRLVIHTCSHSEEGKRYRCDRGRCMRSFTTVAELRRHLQFHSVLGTKTQKRRFQCSQCERNFKMPQYLKLHQRVHIGPRLHGTKKSALRRHCSEDHQKAQGLRLFLQFEESYHRDKSEDSDESGSALSAPVDISVDHYTSQLKLQHHQGLDPLIIYEPEQEPTLRRQGQAEIHNVSLNNTMQLYKETRKNQCDMCGRGFKQPRYLREHKRLHLEHKPHTCTDCGKGFVKPHLLREHRTRHHGEGKGGRRHFLCKECSVQVKLGCTSVTNVFSVTDFTHIKCFMKNHTLI